MASIVVHQSVCKLSKKALNLSVICKNVTLSGYHCSAGVCKNNGVLFTKTWQHTPDQQTVEQLKKSYPHPVQIVDRILEPATRVHVQHHPQLRIRHSRNIWRAYLHFSWPLEFYTCGASTDPSSAEKNAYLLACEMFKDIGILEKDGQVPSYQEKLLRFQRELTGRMLPQKVLEFRSQCEVSKDGWHYWTSVLTLDWPTYLKVAGEGWTQREAETSASMHTFVKLKVSGFLDSQNELKMPTCIMLPVKQSPLESFMPDYELYVDSSTVGVGGYVIDQQLEEESPGTPVRWFQHPWPEYIIERFLEPMRNSTFSEFCGVLTAVYTWKKKFSGKRVLVYNDNLHLVNVLNRGLLSMESTYFKPFLVLQKTCINYKIFLRAQHLHRENNRAADSLSKFNTSAFKEMVPNASPTSKKTIKLLFCLPLANREKMKEGASQTEDSTPG